MTSIRPATVDDVPVMLEMLQESAAAQGFPDAVCVTESELREDGFGPNPRFSALIAEQDGTAAALAVYFFTWSTWVSRNGLHLEDLYVRSAFRRLGLRPVWLRPSYTPLPDMLAFADALAARGASCFNVIFHSSEVLPGGSPYTPDAASVERFLSDLERLLEHLAARRGAVGRTYAEFAAARAASADAARTA